MSSSRLVIMADALHHACVDANCFDWKLCTQILMKKAALIK